MYLLEGGVALFIGIDLSFTGTGLVTVDKNGQLVDQKLIATKPIGRNSSDVIVRVDGIRKCIMDYLESKKCELVSIEGFSFGSKGKALFEIAYLGYRVREDVIRKGILYIEPTPAQVKKFATGKGNASKNIVMLEVYKRWGVEFGNDNLVDAYVLSQIARSVRHDVVLTKFQKDVVEALKK